MKQKNILTDVCVIEYKIKQGKMTRSRESDRVEQKVTKMDKWQSHGNFRCDSLFLLTLSLFFWAYVLIFFKLIEIRHQEHVFLSPNTKYQIPKYNTYIIF